MLCIPLLFQQQKSVCLILPEQSLIFIIHCQWNNFLDTLEIETGMFLPQAIDMHFSLNIQVLSFSGKSEKKKKYHKIGAFTLW